MNRGRGWGAFDRKVSCGAQGQQSSRAGVKLRSGQGEATEGVWPTAWGCCEPGGGFMLNAAIYKEGLQKILILQSRIQAHNSIASKCSSGWDGCLAIKVLFPQHSLHLSSSPCPLALCLPGPWVEATPNSQEPMVVASPRLSFGGFMSSAQMEKEELWLMLLLPKLQESCLPKSMDHAPSAPPKQKGVMERGVWLSRTGN